MEAEETAEPLAALSEAEDEGELVREHLEEHAETTVPAAVEQDEPMMDESETVQEETPDEIDLMLSELEAGSESASSGESEDETAEEGRPAEEDKEAMNKDATSDTSSASVEGNSTNVITEKSARKLESLLMEEDDLESNEALDSLLDSLIGGQP